MPDGVGRAVDEKGNLYEGCFRNGSLAYPYIAYNNPNGWQYVYLRNKQDTKYCLRFKDGKFNFGQRYKQQGLDPVFYRTPFSIG